MDANSALRQRPLDSLGRRLDADQMELWETLWDGPLSFHLLLSAPAQTIRRCRSLQRLVDLGLVVLSEFTSSDAALASIKSA